MTGAPPAVPTATDVAEVVRAHRFAFRDEREFQEGIADALRSWGIAAERECVLADGAGRIDLRVGRVGVEVKVAGSVPQVLRQLGRYARSGRFDELVLVTVCAAHTRVPEAVAGIPVLVVPILTGGL